jgi:hypothetical protein
LTDEELQEDVSSYDGAQIAAELESRFEGTGKLEASLLKESEWKRISCLVSPKNLGDTKVNRPNSLFKQQSFMYNGKEGGRTINNKIDANAIALGRQKKKRDTR